MNKINLTLFVASILLLSNSLLANYQLLIDFNSNWKYYDLGNEPTDTLNNLNWTEISFNDSTWANGNGQLGYGDGDENTIVNDSTLTLYLRKKITILDPEDFDILQLQTIVDDGAIIYINGVEIERFNMPSGIVAYNTFALDIVGENYKFTTIVNSNLIVGENVIAIEIHQKSQTSSDISFDSKIVGHKHNVPTHETIFSFQEEWKYYNQNSLPNILNGKNWYDKNYDDSIWLSGNGQFGYGDGDETTLIEDTIRTAYFRKSFSVTDINKYIEIAYDLIFDDGAIVYLNGTELDRINMPLDSLNHNTLANNGIDNALITKTHDICLLQSNNTIAVEIHQRSLTSSDISFDLQFDAIFLGNNLKITRGPYLQTATANSIIVKYRTTAPIISSISFGTDTNNLNGVYVDTLAKKEHEIKITNLLPNTKYYYQIEHEDTSLISNNISDYYFTTHPTIGTKKSFSAWILGDCGTANNDARSVRDAYYNYSIQNQKADMVLFLGDNAYTEGTDEEYQLAVFENMYETVLQNTTAWSCIGNHEGRSTDNLSQTGPYFDIFSFPKNAEAGGIPSGTEAYYSFDYGSVHFIILDSHQSSRAVGGPMYTWAEMDIQNTNADWIIAFFHHPPYTKGSHNSDTELALVEMRQNFLPMLEANGTDLVLNGHSHAYERSKYINGHYGLSNTFDSIQHIVGVNGSGDGLIGSDGCYKNAQNGNEADKGTVYVVTGSAGKVGGGTLDHSAMYYSINNLGSSILNISGDTLNLKYLRNTGVVEDEFFIVKSTCTVGDTCAFLGDCTYTIYNQFCQCDTIIFDTGDSCNDFNNCTLYDSLDINCNCVGTYLDQDGDGICYFYDLNDMDTLINDLGIICNDNNPCTINDYMDGTGICAGFILDSDLDGICDFYDCKPFDINEVCINDCVDSLNLFQNDILSDWYNAETYIVSSGKVKAYKNVKYQANFLIRLENGFSVEKNTFFEAKIDSCYSN